MSELIQANNNIKVSDQEILQVANLYLLGKSIEDISELSGIDAAQVKWLLTEDKVKGYITKAIENDEMQLHIKRIAKGKVIIDTLLDKVSTMIEEVDISKWRKQHVELIKDFLFKTLPEYEKKLVMTAIQINMNQESKATHNDDLILQALTGLSSDDITLFWKTVELLATQLKKGNKSLIDKVHKQLGAA